MRSVNLDFQKKVFDSEQLPLYVILDPAPGGDDSKIAVVGIYSEGKINDDAAFAQFLKEPLSSAGQRAQALMLPSFRRGIRTVEWRILSLFIKLVMLEGPGDLASAAQFGQTPSCAKTGVPRGVLP